MTLQQAFESAMSHHQAGQLAEAEGLYRQILLHDPRNPEALHLLGVVAEQRGQYADAVDLIRRAIALNPNAAPYYSNLGVALAKQGKLDEAIAAQRKAVALRPDYVLALNNLAAALLASGRLADAVQTYRQSLSLRPDDAQSRFCLANVLRELGQLDEAADAYRRTISLRPEHAEAHNSLGVILSQRGRHDEAAAAYRQAISIQPAYAEAHNNLGIVLGKLGGIDEAIAEYRQAVAHKPDATEPLINLGSALKDIGRLDEAIECYRRALAAGGDSRAADNLLVALNYHPDYGPCEIKEEHARWNEQFARPLLARIHSIVNDPSPDRKLRIGYVSARFHEGRFLTALLANHDRRAFEVFCYADLPASNLEFPKLASYADVWRNIGGLSDEQAAQQVREDRIDILVDLMMHTGGNRLLVFARKPAPVQAAWFGYPGTSGLETMDYRLSDPYLDPPDIDERWYSEKTIRLPHCFWCFDPCGDTPPLNDLPATANGCVTFGCLNNLCKVSHTAIGLWSKVLAAMPRSRFLLLAPGGSTRERIRSQFNEHGIDPARIDFADRQPRRQYLELHHRIDANMDTIPCPGHATTFDSLWMGVPVVTLPGPTAISRGGLSILSNIRLPEMVAGTPDQYVQIASALANDLPRLASLRATLRQRMLDSPLMDGPMFAREMETAYRAMWQTWCDSKSPANPP